MNHRPLALVAALAALAPACTEETPAPVDAGTDVIADVPVDTAPLAPQSTAHCTYEPLTATGNATGMVEAGELRAGTAEGTLDLPVGSTLGAYTARARALGSQSAADNRVVPYSLGFLPSVGVERAPRVRALALSAGGETVVMLEAELGVADDRTTLDVATRLGPNFAGKVLIGTSHSHSSWGHYVANEVLGLGFGIARAQSRAKLLDVLVTTAQSALAAMAPARIGVAHDDNFDPMHMVSHDRRDENDDLPGGRDRADRDLYVVRVDRMDGSPMAVVPIFGIHGTVLGEDNMLASGDAPGAIEEAVEESFDRQVLVMHLQGAAGDVSPGGTGGIDCAGHHGCYNFAHAETVGRYAVGPIRAAWDRAGMSMTSSVSLEMVTRAVPLGPDWRTFNVRSGALSYSPWDGQREADGRIWGDPDAGMNNIVSPIDEFNAPYGAGLCGDNTRTALPSAAQMPGTFTLRPYKSCSRVEEVEDLFGPTLELPLPSRQVFCGSTRTLLSSLRINDWLFVTIPGEPVTLFADRVRAHSPMPADHTVVVGYAQGHVGYVLHPEDWLRGGYEPSINLWGPLEGEYIMERSIELARLAASPQRENAATESATVWRPAALDALPPPDASPRAGTVPTSIPASMFFPSVARLAARPTRAQPDAMVPRLGLARFVWIGEDPRAGTPKLTLQREVTAGRGDFMPVNRRSGRAVRDGDVLLAWTPDPLDNASAARTHYWVAEWQAVTPIGAAFPDDLTARPGVPLGRYRFHIEGTGYTLDSDAFTVTPATLSASATRMGANVVLTVNYEARDGWRLLDMTANSNRPVPLRESTVDLTLDLMGGGTRALMGQRTDAMGRVTIPDAAMVTRVRVVDRHGNSGAASL
ncbi:MAG: neutral/alkaline non-lysosomal ceramidase N-terminal domain-containing protein [Polyangiales bacterium]